MFQKKAFFTLFVLATCATGTAAVGAPENPFLLKTETSDVVSYQVTEKGSARRVEILGAGGQTLGTLLVSQPDLGTVVAEYQSKQGPKLGITLDQELGLATITDWRTGTTGTAGFNLQEREWATDAAFDMLVGMHGAELKRALKGMADTAPGRTDRPNWDSLGANACPSSASSETEALWGGERMRLESWMPRTVVWLDQV